MRSINGLRLHKHTASSANAKFVTSAFFSALQKIIFFLRREEFNGRKFLGHKKPSAAKPQPIGQNDNEEPRKAGIRDSVTVERRKFQCFFSDL